MKPRYQKKKNAGCAQYILDAVHEKYLSAITKTPLPGGNGKESKPWPRGKQEPREGKLDQY